MNKRQRKKRIWSISEYSNSDEFKKQDDNLMFGSPQSNPHGWCMIEGHEWSEYVQENEIIKIPNQV